MFRDVVGDGFNIDHVVVSPRGIFVIETKTNSTSNRGSDVVEFDEGRILVNGVVNRYRAPFLKGRAS